MPETLIHLLTVRLFNGLRLSILDMVPDQTYRSVMGGNRITNAVRDATVFAFKGILR